MRSASLELDLEAGEYIVMVKIVATRTMGSTTIQDAVKISCEGRREKLLAVGLSYDLAHAKGRLIESEKDRQEQLGRERRDKRKKTAKKNFETQRSWNMKAKLRMARLQAIKESKKGGRKDQNGKDKVDITIKIGENTFQSSDQVAHENGIFEHAVTGKKLKVTVEAVDEKGPDEIQQRGDSTGKGTNDEHKSNLPEPNSEPQQDRQGKPASRVSTASEKATSGQESPESATTPNPTPESSTGGDPQAGEETEIKTSSDADELAHKLASSKLSSPPPPPKPTFDDISDDDLSWSSDIDAPPDTDSDMDSESGVSEEDTPKCGKCKSKILDPLDEKIEEFKKNPWNAVCVIGLRVYSKGAQAKVEVTRKRDNDQPSKNEMLDMDDQAADATKELGKQSEEEEKKLEDVGKVPEHEEESKQG